MQHISAMVSYRWRRPSQGYRSITGDVKILIYRKLCEILTLPRTTNRKWHAGLPNSAIMLVAYVIYIYLHALLEIFTLHVTDLLIMWFCTAVQPLKIFQLRWVSHLNIIVASRHIACRICSAARFPLILEGNSYSSRCPVFRRIPGVTDKQQFYYTVNKCFTTINISLCWWWSRQVGPKVCKKRYPLTGCVRSSRRRKQFQKQDRKTAEK